jgi:hypothetical protein
MGLFLFVPDPFTGLALDAAGNILGLTFDLILIHSLAPPDFYLGR